MDRISFLKLAYSKLYPENLAGSLISAYRELPHSDKTATSLHQITIQ